MDFSDKVTVSPQILVSRIDDELIILDLASNTYFGLNAVGTQIWNSLSEGKTIAETCKEISDKYDVSPDDIERDVVSLTSELLSKNLVIRQPFGQSQSDG